MKILRTALIMLVLSFPAHTLNAQDTGSILPRLEKRSVGSKGAAVYLLQGSSDWEESKSEDGSNVFVAEGETDSHFFMAIVVEFVPPQADATPAEMEEVLVSYMEFIQDQFDVVETVGIGTGHIKENVPNARGVIDFWLDSDGYEYAVKGWVNSDYLALLAVYGDGEYPHYHLQQMFLNGFRFPDEQ